MTNTGRPFNGTHYEYCVSLGTVLDKDALGWDTHVYCKRWQDVELVIDAWRESHDYPAVEVEASYRPKDKSNPNTV